MSWLIRTDVGGTFTDCVAVDPRGARHAAKVLSTGVLRARIGSVTDETIVLAGGWSDRLAVLAGGRAGDRVIRAVSGGTLTLGRGHGFSVGDAVELGTGEPAPILAARMVTRTPFGKPLPACDFRLATTRATNALLERRFAKAALITTGGFADVLRIGDQRRPDVYELNVRKPRPLTELTLGVRGRVGPDGSVVDELDEAGVRDAADRARREGAQTAAVCLVGAWANDAQELRAAEICREAGFETVALSSRAAPRIGLWHRAIAATLEAALAPVLTEYLEEVRRPLAGSSLRVLTSAGGLTPAERYRPVDSLLSGPAGGVVGAGAAARDAGEARAIAFDMGGTSTDVARIEGPPTLSPSHTVGDVTVVRPAVAVRTVAAGGGSVCHVLDGRPAVGPHSAGADPGPACYGRGGPMAITDVNLLMGRLDTEAFEIPIDEGAAAAAGESLRAELESATGERIDRDELCAGVLEIACETMAEAIRGVSIREGYDPAEHALVAFGGAGPQHACDVAARLGVRTVIVPPDASLLSAVGLHEAREETIREREVQRPLEATGGAIREMLDELEADATAELGEAVDVRRSVRLRFEGQDSAIEIDDGERGSLGGRFVETYRRFRGVAPDRAVEVAGLRVVARAAPSEPLPALDAGEPPVGTSGRRRVHDGERWVEARVVDRASEELDAPIDGPAIVRERRTQTWVPGGWRVRRSGDGTLRLEHAGEHARAERPEVIARELIVRRLAAISEQMGDALETAAISVNVKDRRDYSCGVLDAEGRLVSSAAHMPVHLGALGPCVRGVIDAVGHLGPGDAVLTNHPAFGGSHLPDLTVVQPVFDGDGQRVAYVASRAHHAEVGGLTPGSMPPHAVCLADEGVPIAPLFIARGGVFLEDELRRVLLAHRAPTRAIEDNVADLAAAVVAGAHAGELIGGLVARDGRDRVLAAMNWINGHTAGLVRARIAAIGGLPASVVERLDDGAEIRVRFSREGERLVLDFGGTSATHAKNINAPLAVTRAAVAYVVRLILDHDIPLNDGFLEPIDVRVPEGCFLNPVFDADPERSPPVAGGNVETSQRITDALLRGLGLCAGGPATMNNTLLGNAGFGVYETVCSGAPAAPGHDGEHAVHQHMTNTRITDAEVLERRYPLRVHRFEIRRGSGGDGRWRGGDGAVREIEALEPITVTTVAQRRVEGAPGVDGGRDGTTGRHSVVRASGEIDPLAWSDLAEIEAGDRVRVETPGGGGWGTPGA